MRKNLRSIQRMLLLFLIILGLLVAILLLPGIISRSPRRRQKLAARIMQWHLKAMTKACGLRIHLRGELPKPGETFLLLSNHVSYWDILALGALFPLGFIAKDSIASWPILGTVTSLCNTIYVNRENVFMRCRTLRILQKKIQDLPYCVFPEGTTTASASPKLALWHRGNIAVVRQPGVPVWLAGLHYGKHEEQAWIDDDALLPHLFKVMKSPHIDLMIQLQPLVVDPKTPLRHVSMEAWRQTAKLCQKAKEEMQTLPASTSIHLCKAPDSAVS